jgi:hypothetical protein
LTFSVRISRNFSRNLQPRIFNIHDRRRRFTIKKFLSIDAEQSRQISETEIEVQTFEPDSPARGKQSSISGARSNRSFPPVIHVVERDRSLRRDLAHILVDGFFLPALNGQSQLGLVGFACFKQSLSDSVLGALKGSTASHSESPLTDEPEIHVIGTPENLVTMRTNLLPSIRTS